MLLSFSRKGTAAHRGEVTDQAELRNHIASERHGNEDRGNRIGKGHHAILRDLRIGDALHAAEAGIRKDNRRANQYPGGILIPKSCEKTTPTPRICPMI